MMKNIDYSLKKLLSITLALAVMASGFSLSFSAMAETEDTADIHSSGIQTIDNPNTNEESYILYADFNLLCKGQTASGSVKQPQSIIINGTTIPVMALKPEEISVLQNKYDIFINEYIYKFEVKSAVLEALMNEKCKIQLKADSKTFDIGKSDLSNATAYTKKLSFVMPDDLELPCLYLSSYTTAISFLNGYWSELGEVNTIGFNQYEIEQLEMGYNSKYKKAKPETSIQVEGKVYDFYDDADLNGIPKTIKKAGVDVSNVWDHFYYKFNDAVSDYYKEANLDYYDYYSNSSYRDTSPAKGSLYSQSFGIVNPFYLGYIEKSKNPVNSKNTSYGLFGIDSSYNYDPVSNKNIRAVDRIAAITLSTKTIANITVPAFSAYKGIVADHLGENGEIMANTVDPENRFSGVQVPYFNEDFLNGDNSLHTAIGKVFDATYMFDRKENVVNGKRVYTYSLAQDTRFFYNQDGSRDTELYKNNSKTSGIYKELMPLNYMINNQEYTNPGYAQRIDVPFVLPDDDEEYTMTVQGDDCVWIYLDGELIIDLGGLNYIYNSNHIEGTINFTKGISKVNNVRTTNGVENNVIKKFNVNDGRRHKLTIVQIDNYTGEGCVFVDTNLPLEYIIPKTGEPKNSYEIENNFSAPEMTECLTAFIDSLDFKNSVYVDAPHKAGEMDIIPTNKTSVFNSSYTGEYKDRLYYEMNDNWTYHDGEAITNRQENIELGNKEVYAALGLIYEKDAIISSNAYQTANYVQTYLKVNEKNKDLTNLFNTEVNNYKGDGLYSYSQFLLGKTKDKYKHLKMYKSSDNKIPSLEYPGNNFGNYAWTNKTIVNSTMKTGSLTIDKTVTNYPYDFMSDDDSFTFTIYYMNIEDVFGTMPEYHDTYNGKPCISDTVTLKNGESVSVNVPVGVHCIVVENDTPDYENITKGDKSNYYDFTVTDGFSKDCSFTNKYTGKYLETTEMTVNIEWIDGSNNLNTRPDFSTLTPFDKYQTTETQRSNAITFVVFKGADGKWYQLNKVIDSTKSADIYNRFAQMLETNVTSGDINAVTVSNLPKYALAYMSKNIGNNILPEGSEMNYGLLQLKYGEYVVTPFDNALGGGVQPNGETIVDTLYGSLTVNKYGTTSLDEKCKLDNVEFKLYSTESDLKSGRNSVASLKTSNGRAYLSPLAVGEYWLAETKTADGYEMITEPIKFAISYDSTSTLYKVIDLDNKRTERDIKITKQVDMTYGDISESDYKNQGFDFEVAFTQLDPSTKYAFEYSKDGVKTTGEFVSKSDGCYLLDFQLTDDQTLTIKNLPKNANYQITEKKVFNYISSYNAICNSEAKIVKASDSNAFQNQDLSTAWETVDVDGEFNDFDVEFIFKNTYDNYVLPNAGLENCIPVLIAALSGAVFFGALYLWVNVKKRKKV